MRSVWSFWSKPFHSHESARWSSSFHHLLAWEISVRAAGRHYPDTVLITDKPGKRLLVDRLGLEFATVSTELESLNAADSGLWALGKLLAYSLQDCPFLHLDTDVFLWKPLPPALADSPVITQCFEGFHNQNSAYHPEEIEWAFAQERLRLPVEWEWMRKERGLIPSQNCGILGGGHIEFLRYYSRTALDLALRSEYAAAWSRIHDKRNHNLVIEQFFLAACAEFHGSNPTSPYAGVRIDSLFPSWDSCFDPKRTARIGFTHLMTAKSHPAVASRLEDRVRRENPAYFRRCRQIHQTMPPSAW
jgi:hypothetical protein